MTGLPGAPKVIDLSGKTALVTGATSGFGYRFAHVLARAGASVAIGGRRTERLEALAAEIEAFDGRALPLKLDVTDADNVEHAVETTTTELGHIDILVNNAGVNIQARAEDLDEAGYDFIMDTNVKGAFLMATVCARRMMARGEGGRIVNIASIGAQKVLPGLSVYCMSKAAVAMMTRSLGREWAKHNINVTAICPGYVETELNSEWFNSEAGKKQIAGFPKRRLQDIESLDATLLLLCSEQSSAITGSMITVDDAQVLG